MPKPSREVGEQRNALVRVEIAGKVYDAARVPQCATCTHPARIEIERRLLLGHGYREIATYYSETEYVSGGLTKVFPPVGFMSIRNHFKSGHMPVEAAVLRQITEERARELSEHYEEETAKIVDGYSFARQVLHKAQESLISGDVKVGVQDGIAAARLLREMETQAGGDIDAEVWSQAMTVYFETAQKIMPPEMWVQFTTLLAQNPVLVAIQKRLEATPDDTIDAEIVDEGESE